MPGERPLPRRTAPSAARDRRSACLPAWCPAAADATRAGLDDPVGVAVTVVPSAAATPVATAALIAAKRRIAAAPAATARADRRVERPGPDQPANLSGDRARGASRGQLARCVGH